MSTAQIQRSNQHSGLGTSDQEKLSDVATYSDQSLQYSSVQLNT